MEAFLIFGTGLAVGALLAWAVITINLQFQESKRLRSGADKARKEIREKSIKARADSQKARAQLVRSTVSGILIVVLVIVLGWLAIVAILPNLW